MFAHSFNITSRDSIIERNIPIPSSEEYGLNKESEARSGWGIIPRTLPSELETAAILDIEPLGLLSIEVLPSESEYLNTI